MSKKFSEALAGVDRVADNVSENVRFRKLFVSATKSLSRDNALKQFFLIVTIHDREIFLKSELLRVATQDPISNRMKSSSPKLRRSSRKKVVNAIEHFASCFVGEREEQDLFGCVSLF